MNKYIYSIYTYTELYGVNLLSRWWPMTDCGNERESGDTGPEREKESEGGGKEEGRKRGRGGRLKKMEEKTKDRGREGMM